MAEQDKPFVINDRRKFRMDGELREPAPEPSAATASTAAAATASPAPTPEAAQPGKPAVAPAVVPSPNEASAKVIPFGDAPAHREHTHHEGLQSESQASAPIPINSAHMITPVPEPGEYADPAAPEDEGAESALPPPPSAEEIAQVKKAYDATSDRLETVMRATNPGGEHLPPMDFTRMVQSIYMSAMMQLGAGTPQGEQARVDLIGAKQSIDMLGVIAGKAQGGLDGTETRLIESALFELQMGFLEITQMLARQAAAKQGAPGSSPFGAGPGAPGGPRIVT